MVDGPGEQTGYHLLLGELGGQLPGLLLRAPHLVKTIGAKLPKALPVSQRGSHKVMAVYDPILDKTDHHILTSFRSVSTSHNIKLEKVSSFCKFFVPVP